MSKPNQLTDLEIQHISEQSQIEFDIVKSWYKGKKLNHVYMLYDLV